MSAEAAAAAAPASDTADAAADAAPVFKRKGNASNIRKRNRDANGAEEESEPAATPAAEASADPDRPNRPQKKDPTIFSTKDLKVTDEKHIRSAFSYSASNTAVSLSDQKTFAYNTIDGDEESKAAALKRQKELKEGDVITDPDDPRLKDAPKQYRGLAAYSSHIEKKPPQIKTGPIQGASNIRITCRFDYQPDLCKDYKETGYCCFGDSCKFMHDRGDYKSGWQLEKEWEANQYGKADTENFEVQEQEEELPFACHICREPFTNPVVTKCEHYFCESCALNSYKKNNKCAVCGAPTQGIFNVAHKLIAKLKQRKRAADAAATEENK